MTAERPYEPDLTAAGVASNGIRPESDVPPAPSDLAAIGVAVWEGVWREPQIGAGDRLAVERLARLECEAAALRVCVAEDGHCLKRPIQSATGAVIGTEVIPHPALLPLRKIGVEAQVLCDSLGLTPSSRQRLGLDVLTRLAEPDKVDQLKARRAQRRKDAFGI